IKTNHHLTKVKHVITTIISYKHFKPLLWTIITASCVGMFLGYVVLKIVAEDEYVATENIVAMNQQDENETEDQMELPGFSLFVLQSGVFTEMENAERLGKQMEKKQSAYAIREMDDNHYVWLLAAPNETTADQHKKRLEKQDINTIVKKWDIPKDTITLTEQESKWLQLYIDTLSEAIQSEKVNQIEWEELVKEDNPIQSYSSWYEELQTIILQEKITEEQLMLQLFLHYEKLIEE